MSRNSASDMQDEIRIASQMTKCADADASPRSDRFIFGPKCHLLN